MLQERKKQVTIISTGLCNWIVNFYTTHEVCIVVMNYKVKTEEIYAFSPTKKRDNVDKIYLICSSTRVSHKTRV